MTPWRHASSLLAWGAALVLLACAHNGPAQPAAPLAETTPASAHAAGGCDAGPAKGIAIGQAATPALAERVRQLAGARTVRTIGHDEMVTKEYNATRVNLQLDAGGRVVNVYCG